MQPPLTEAGFAGLMQPLGPWDGVGTIAVAVSGGADSLCLALLAQRWASGRDAGCTAFIVDHGLRQGSGDEALATSRRLARVGMACRILRAEGLQRGPGLAARARSARYDLLTGACIEAGIVDLLVAHHAGDQAETALMRRRAGSGPDGLAAMAQLVETLDLRLLRPLLGVAPDRLRATLRAAGLEWIEDPSNRDSTALRTRLRRELAEAGGEAPKLLRELAAAGGGRMARQHDCARLLASMAELRPQGHALLPPALVAVPALAHLMRTVGGGEHAPSMAAVAALVDRPRAATLGGTRLLPAGRLGSGWLLVREAAAMHAAVPAVDGALWDGRFRLRLGNAALPAGTRIGGAGPGAARIRSGAGEEHLPAAVLAAMPRLTGPSDAGVELPHGASFSFEPRLAATSAARFAERTGHG